MITLVLVLRHSKKQYSIAFECEVRIVFKIITRNIRRHDHSFSFYFILFFKCSLYFSPRPTCSVRVGVVVVRADASSAMKLVRKNRELDWLCTANLTSVAAGSSDWLNAAQSSAALH